MKVYYLDKDLIADLATRCKLSDADIAGNLGVPTYAVSTVRRSLQITANGKSLLPTINPIKNAVPITRTLRNNCVAHQYDDRVDRIEEASMLLSDMDRQILEWTRTGWTLGAIGKRTGYTRERIRQKRNMAIRKIRMGMQMLDGELYVTSHRKYELSERTGTPSPSVQVRAAIKEKSKLLADERRAGRDKKIVEDALEELIVRDSPRQPTKPTKRRVRKKKVVTPEKVRSRREQMRDRNIDWISHWKSIPELREKFDLYCRDKNLNATHFVYLDKVRRDLVDLEIHAHAELKKLESV
jgi:DNA-binding CsgD family transcriptional regulator